jgi:hypothetical protein
MHHLSGGFSMLPTWFCNFMARLPGRPIIHVKIMAALVFLVVAVAGTLIVLNLKDYEILAYPVLAFVGLIIFLDRKLSKQDTLDMRDWLVLRGVTSAYWVGSFMVMLVLITTYLPINFVTTCIIVWLAIVAIRDAMLFHGVLRRASELSNWHTSRLIHRKREEVGEKP